MFCLGHKEKLAIEINRTAYRIVYKHYENWKCPDCLVYLLLVFSLAQLYASLMDGDGEGIFSNFGLSLLNSWTEPIGRGNDK
jgi:hypothetical protein